MLKIFLRFFVLCLLFTIIISYLLIMIYHALEDKITSQFVDVGNNPKYQLLIEYLEKNPENDWPSIVNKIQPKNASTIHILAIKDIHLNQAELDQLMKGNLVYKTDFFDKYHPNVIYKRIDQSNFVIKDWLTFTTTERIQRFVGWYPVLFQLHLSQIPKSEWQKYLSTFAKNWVIPVSIQNITSTDLTDDQKKLLLKEKWFYNKISKSEEVIYAILNNNDIIKFGPIHYSAMAVYEIYFIFFSALIIIELIIFILAFFYIRSIEKLKKIANEYSQGNFDSKIQIGKSSSLFSLYENLKNMGHQIKTLLASHKELTDHISHDLLTPISRMQFALESIKNNTNKDELKAKIADLNEDILELEMMVKDILNSSMLDRNQMIAFKQLNLKNIVQIAVNKFIKSGSTKKMITDITNKRTLAFANRESVLRVLHNLFQNADKFAKSTIKISLTPNQIIVEDDGSGILDSDKEIVFQPFYKKTEKAKGYGLGLAIVKKIINQLDWQIWIKDSNMGGAKFIIKFK